MKKNYKVLVNIAIVLIIIFGIILFIDYIKYDELVNSAPFTANIMVRFVEFIVPSIMLLFIARYLKKKGKKHE